MYLGLRIGVPIPMTDYIDLYDRAAFKIWNRTRTSDRPFIVGEDMLSKLNLMTELSIQFYDHIKLIYEKGRVEKG